MKVVIVSAFASVVSEKNRVGLVFRPPGITRVTEEE